MYYGYDNQGIKRVYAETREDAEIVARDYLASRLDVKFLKFLKLGKNKRPMMQGQFKVCRN
jgi:hypothetical protein